MDETKVAHDRDPDADQRHLCHALGAHDKEKADETGGEVGCEDVLSHHYV